MNGYNFTDRVRKVLQLARQRALELGSGHVRTEHLLAGLVGEGGGVARAVLAELWVDTDELQERIEGSVERRRPTDQGRDLPYTSRAKKVLEFALREVQALGHTYVGTEHLLLGMLHAEATPAVNILAAVGVQNAIVSP